MKSKGIKYLFFVLYGMLVATGPICMIYMTTPVDPGNIVLWLILPYALLIVGAMTLVMKILYPRLFIKGRYLSFALYVWALCYLVDIVALYIGHYFTSYYHLPHYLKNPHSPLLLLSTVSSSMLSALTMAGFFLWRFYDYHQEQNRYEKEYSREIEEKTESLRRRIRMPEIKAMLKEARATLKNDPDLANDQILDISDYLRRNLYHKTEKMDKGNSLPDRHWEAESSRTSAFISERKWRPLRHIMMLGVIAVICFGLMFDYPDEIYIDSFHIQYSLTFFCIVSGLIYANIFLIFPFFLKKNRHRLYAVLLLSISFTAFIALNAVSLAFGPPHNPFGIKMPWYIVPFAVAGNMMTFFLLMAGSAAIVLLRSNILGKWRLSRLEARTAEIEFATLQHQINPHTLFNFLNNIAILGYDDPEEAARTLMSLEELLDYIIADTSRDETTIGEEVKFIRNYLTLEKSSGRALEVEICCPDAILPFSIPPLMLIPFVENAVKHSRSVGKERKIEIAFRPTDKGVRFICCNSCSEVEPEESNSRKKSGGLGIANTQRRLQLLFGEAYNLSFDRTPGTFTVDLALPSLHDVKTST